MHVQERLKVKEDADKARKDAEEEERRWGRQYSAGSTCHASSTVGVRLGRAGRAAMLHMHVVALIVDLLLSAGV